MPGNSVWILFIYLLLYVAFDSQGHIATASLQVEETSAYCTVNHQASTSNYKLSNMKRFKPAAPEVRENSNRYTTEPPKNSIWKLIDKDILLGFTIHYILQQ